jgi:excisionase family DNA binding protein
VSRSTNSLERRYVTLAEAAVYLGRTQKALRRLVERRAVPFHRAGRRLVFDLHELDQWVGRLPGVALEEALDRCADGSFIPQPRREQHV